MPTVDPFRRLNRRQILQRGVALATGAAFAGLTRSNGLTAQQLPAPEPLLDNRMRFVTTTETQAWQRGELFKSTFSWNLLNLNVDLSQTRPSAQAMQGFGGCFNELGWTSLQKLSERDRENVLHELFDPAAGARFSYYRMPIGANDFATEAYSYDETENDFGLKHFSMIEGR